MARDFRITDKSRSEMNFVEWLEYIKSPSETSHLDKVDVCNRLGCKPNAFHMEECPFYTPIPVRPPWDAYFLGIADAVSKRADCSRRQVGAILVTKDRRHRGSGYNGGRSGGPSCLRGECPRGLRSTSEVAPGSSYDTGAGICIAVHAEQNVILDTYPQDRKDGTFYITCAPCDGCLRMLQASGCVRIVWPDGSWNFEPVSSTWYLRGDGAL